MIAVDTNVLVHFFLPSPHAEDTRAVYEKDKTWAAPLLWRSEFRNVLTLHSRRGLLSNSEVHDLMRLAEIFLQGREHLPSSAQVLQLALDSGCTAYDCEFISVAQELDAPLLTYDKALLTAFPQVARSVPSFIHS